MFQKAAHGTFQGVMSEINGGSFIQGFAAGALSSIAASAFSGGQSSNIVDGKRVPIAGSGWGGAGKFAHNTVGMIAFGTVMGGAGAALTGGNFWQGAVTGLVVSGLNHAMHQGDNYEASTDPDPTDPPSAFQTALDGIGMTEIPILSQGAELISACMSFANGDITGGVIGLGSMIPLGGKAFEAMKVGRFATKTISRLSDTKVVLKQVHDKLGGSLPKGLPGKFGSPQRGTSLKGYRLDPGHPGRPFGHPESGPHINYWDYTNGNRGKGGISGAIPIK
jgi:hypothetical protein